MRNLSFFVELILTIQTVLTTLIIPKGMRAFGELQILFLCMLMKIQIKKKRQ